MNLKMKLNVQPDELYEYMTYIIAKQVENTFGEPVSPSQIKKGYSHKIKSPTAGKSQKVRYTITKAVPGKLFETTYSSGARKTVVTYKIEPAGNKTNLIYDMQTTVFSGPKANTESRLSFSNWWTKQKTKWSMRKAIRQIQRMRA